MFSSLEIELLLHKLRTDLSVIRFPSWDVSFKLSAYADDVIVLVNYQTDINILVNTVNLFGCIFSAKVTWEKSEAIMWGTG